MNEPPRYQVVVCRGPECGERRGSAALHAEFHEKLRERGILDRCELVWQSCFGRCTVGPNVLVRPAPRPSERFVIATAPVGAGQNAAFYAGVLRSDVVRIVDAHVLRGRIVRDLVVRPGSPGKPQGGEPR